MKRLIVSSLAVILTLFPTAALVGCSGSTPSDPAQAPSSVPAPDSPHATPSAPTTTPGKTTAPSPEAPLEKRLVRDADGLNLRESPSTDAKVITVLPKGEGMEVLQRQGSWLQVRTATGIGWVVAEYTEPYDEAPAKAPAGKPAAPPSSPDGASYRAAGNWTSADSTATHVIRWFNKGYGLLDGTYRVLQAADHWDVSQETDKSAIIGSVTYMPSNDCVVIILNSEMHSYSRLPTTPSVEGVWQNTADPSDFVALFADMVLHIVAPYSHQTADLSDAPIVLEKNINYFEISLHGEKVGSFTYDPQKDHIAVDYQSKSTTYQRVEDPYVWKK